MRKLYFIADMATMIMVYMSWGFWWAVLALFFAPLFWIYFTVKLAYPHLQYLGVL